MHEPSDAEIRDTIATVQKARAVLGAQDASWDADSIAVVRYYYRRGCQDALDAKHEERGCVVAAELAPKRARRRR